MGAGADERLAERNDPAGTQESDFPRYLMVIDGKESFMPLRTAGVKFDSGWEDVRIGGKVLEADYSVRDITSEEEAAIQRIADAYSASK